MHEGPSCGRNLSSAGNPTLEPNIMSIDKLVAMLWPFCISKMTVSRHLGFYRTANSAIRSADSVNHSLEPNMEWIGCIVCKIFAFKLYCDLENEVWGHSRSPKVALFDRAHTALYSFSIVNMPLSITVSELHIGRKSLYALVFCAPPLGVNPSDYATTLFDENLE